MRNDDKVVQLNIRDEMGLHHLQADSYVIKCKSCKTERHLYENDIKSNEIKPVVCSCGGENEFRYWLDTVYTEEEYDELLKKIGR